MESEESSCTREGEQFDLWMERSRLRLYRSLGYSVDVSREDRSSTLTSVMGIVVVCN